MDVWDVDTAVALMFNFMFSGQPRYGKPLTPAKRDFYTHWITFLAHYYPSAKGRASFAALATKTKKFWPQYDAAKGINVTYYGPEKHRELWTLAGHQWEDFSQGWHGCQVSEEGESSKVIERERKTR